MVTSTLALVVALGGTAYAADTVGSSDIINESLLSEDIKNGEVTTADAAADSLGRSPRLWAQIRANGSRIRGTAVAATRPATGRYTVTFDRTVATSPSPMSADFTAPSMMSELPMVSAAYAVPLSATTSASVLVTMA